MSGYKLLRCYAHAIVGVFFCAGCVFGVKVFAQSDGDVGKYSGAVMVQDVPQEPLGESDNGDVESVVTDSAQEDEGRANSDGEVQKEGAPVERNILSSEEDESVQREGETRNDTVCVSGIDCAPVQRDDVQEVSDDDGEGGTPSLSAQDEDKAAEDSSEVDLSQNNSLQGEVSLEEGVHEEKKESVREKSPSENRAQEEEGNVADRDTGSNGENATAQRNTEDTSEGNSLGRDEEREKGGDTVCDEYSKDIVIEAVSLGDALSSRNDMVRLRNRGDACVHLDRYKLRRLYNGTRSGVATVKNVSITAAFTKDDVLPVGGAFYWARKGSRFADRADKVSGSSLAEDSVIALVFDRGDADEVIDFVRIGDAPEHTEVFQGRSSFLAQSVDNPSDREFVFNSGDAVVLREQCMDDFLRTEPCVPTYAGEKVVISEIFPNPFGDESIGEYVELYNPTAQDINMHGWRIGDASASGRHTFAYGTVLPPHTYAVLTREQFSFALNNSNESVTVWAPDGTVVDHVEYVGSVPEGRSLNRTAHGAYRWSKYRTPGAENRFNTLPKIESTVVDDDIYRNIPAHFSARAYDGDGDVLKYRWDFGDGHRSYRSETTHTYRKRGTYAVSLRIADGSEEVWWRSTVDVRRYPRNDSIKIIAITPNPQGKDAGHEYIVMKNSGKRSVDLSRWSIATGSKKEKLVNHPLRERIVLKPGRTVKISSDQSAIALPNARGFVEVCRPDGSVAYDKKYRAPDGYKTVPEGAVYEKRSKENGSGWVWNVLPKREERSMNHKEHNDSSEVAAIVARAWENEFGGGVRNKSPQVRGAAIVRSLEETVSWHRVVAQYVNEGIARVAQSIARLRVGSNAPTEYVVEIDRSKLPKGSVHPAIIALSVVGLSEKSVAEVLTH